MYNKIINENDSYTELFNKLNNTLQPKFELYKKKIIQNKKLKEENEKKYKNRIIPIGIGIGKDGKENTKINTKDNHYKYITNDIMDELSNFYFNTYDNKDISVDADEIRIKWFQKNFDNGRFLFKTLFCELR